MSLSLSVAWWKNVFHFLHFFPLIPRGTLFVNLNCRKRRIFNFSKYLTLFTFFPFWQTGENVKDELPFVRQKRNQGEFNATQVSSTRETLYHFFPKQISIGRLPVSFSMEAFLIWGFLSLCLKEKQLTNFVFSAHSDMVVENIVPMGDGWSQPLSEKPFDVGLKRTFVCVNIIRACCWNKMLFISRLFGWHGKTIIRVTERSLICLARVLAFARFYPQMKFIFDMEDLT